MISLRIFAFWLLLTIPNPTSCSFLRSKTIVNQLEENSRAVLSEFQDPASSTAHKDHTFSDLDISRNVASQTQGARSMKTSEMIETARHSIDSLETSLTTSETDSPTNSPTDSPTDSPTNSPTDPPTDSSSRREDFIQLQENSPTSEPTVSPTSSPTSSPTDSSTPGEDFTKLQENSPTSEPTVSPTSSPTLEPTASPTLDPTPGPTMSPTSSPTRNPTLEPTTLHPTSNPTASPTSSPTSNPTFAPSISPSFNPTVVRSASWFNYDPNSDVGPDNWDKVSVHDSEFLHFLSDPTNVCATEKRQSPVNVRQNKACADDHTYGRSRGQMKFSELDFQITPTSLRVYFRDQERAPRSNWSNLSSSIPALGVDIKIKSEHYLNGQQYAGEFQLYFHFDDKEGYVVLSMMMDDSEDQHNVQLEQFIREWEEAAWKKKNQCDKLNDPDNTPFYSRTYVNILSKKQITKIWDITDDGRADFDIFRLMTSGWYCGYKGSLTVPPCTRAVQWRILDVPMKMSKSQLQRMQNLIVERLDENCNQVTAAYNGQVNRPLREDRSIWCCNSDNWEFREKDPLFWLDSWPLDYHGWKSVGNYTSLVP